MPISYYGGVIEVTESIGNIRTVITEKGQEKLSSMSRSELLLYFLTINETQKISVVSNLMGTGPVCHARDFAAFKVLSEMITSLLMKKDTNDGAPQKDRYDFLKDDK